MIQRLVLSEDQSAFIREAAIRSLEAGDARRKELGERASVQVFSGESKLGVEEARAVVASDSDAVASAKGFSISDHALSLYATCTKNPCPHRSGRTGA